MAHDAGDAAFQVGAADSGDAGERGFDAEFTDFQDALGIDMGFATGIDDGFVARALAIFDEAVAEPPDDGMEPE